MSTEGHEEAVEEESPLEEESPHGKKTIHELERELDLEEESPPEKEAFKDMEEDESPLEEESPREKEAFEDPEEEDLEEEDNLRDSEGGAYEESPPRLTRRKRPYTLQSPFPSYDTRERWQYIRKCEENANTLLRNMHRRAGVEYVLVTYDPIKNVVLDQTTPGLEGIWDGNKPHVWAPLVHKHHLYRNAMAKALQTSERGEGISFQNMGGGLQAQRKITEVALSMAIPGRERSTKTFYLETTTEDFRKMICKASGYGYSSWPQDLSFKHPDEMDVQELEKAFTWAVKFVAKYDTHAMVRRLALSDAIETEDNVHLTSEGRYNIAMRIIRGIIGETGTYSILSQFFIFPRGYSAKSGRLSVFFSCILFAAQGMRTAMTMTTAILHVE